MYQIWIYIIALLIVIPSTLLGCFLLLRKSVMVSDGISHSILPGLVIGFLVTKSLYSPILLLFASLFGVFTIVLMEWIYKNDRIKKEASISISFTFLFAVGILLIANFTSENTELHQECILYGDLNAVPLHTLFINGIGLGPKALWTLLLLNICVISCLFIGWRALNVTSFDPIYATSIGFNPKKWNYILMTLVALTVVIAFDIVGAILIISIIAAPAASAYLFCKQLKSFILLSLFLGIIYTLLGISISFYFNLILSATLALVFGVLFLVSFFTHKFLFDGKEY